MSSMTTEEETMALNALDDPRKMHPKTTTKKTVRYKAFKGTLSLSWTLAKNLEAGKPPSLLFLR